MILIKIIILCGTNALNIYESAAMLLFIASEHCNTPYNWKPAFFLYLMNMTAINRLVIKKFITRHCIVALILVLTTYPQILRFSLLIFILTTHIYHLISDLPHLTTLLLPILIILIIPHSLILDLAPAYPFY